VSGAAAYWVFRSLSAICGLLPEPVVRRLGYSAGWFGSFFARRKFAMAVRHQTRVAGTTRGARRAARHVFGWYGRYWADVFWMRPRRRDQVLASSHMDGVENLMAGVRSGRGVILALPHMGNWEAGGLRCAAEGAPVLAAAEELGNERIVQWFVKMRGIMHIDIVVARPGARVTRELLARLQEGGVVALVCDRDLSGRGIAVEFFGEETTLPAGPLALAERTGAVLLPAAAYFNRGKGYRFVVHPPLELPPAGDSEARVLAGTQRLAAKLEEVIRVAPEQWHLIVPNWPSDREPSQ
jgi:lauroyl/myristoyl acyltransferase